MMPVPDEGRRFAIRRVAGLGDCDTFGKLRLDALARLLQDVATAAAQDAGVAPGWVLRSTAVNAARWPDLGERLVLTTFCSGLGPRWAERRTSVSGDRGTCLATRALWIHV